MNSIERKQIYHAFCDTQTEPPLFFQPWWLDAVCVEGEWDICLSFDKGGNVRGVLPYYLKKYYGFTVSTMPMLTPYLGPWLLYPARRKDRFSFEKKVMDELIEQFPSVTYSRQDFPLRTQNCLPFYWQGFETSTVYTFRLESGLTKEQVFAQFNGDVRNKIRKAEQILQIQEIEDPALFYQINQKTFSRQGLQPPYDMAFLQRLDQELDQRQARKILLAMDQENRPHAAIYLVQDHECVYNLMLGADTQLRSSGAVQYLLWQGIQWAIQQGKVFDFEGSMLPGVASVFNGFGGQLVPYQRVTRGKNKLFQVLKVLFAKW